MNGSCICNIAGFYKDVEEFSMRGVNSKEMIAFIGYGRERGGFF